MKDPDTISKTGMWRAGEQTGVHLMMLGIYTVFSIVLIGVTLLLAWEIWTIPLIMVSIGAVWALRIFQIGTETKQIYLYTGMLLLEFFYYGAHEGSFFELSVFMCILLLVLPVFGEIGLVYIAAGTYGLEFLYHLIFLDTIRSLSDLHAAVQLCLGIGVVIGAVMIAGYFIGRNQSERGKIQKIITALDAVNSRSEDFLANVSHELRTPINAVTGISDIVLQRELPTGLREDMIAIQQAGKRLAGQINDILDYTDLIAGRLKVSNEDYLISSSINDMVVMADVQNRENRLELIFDIDPDIPSVLIGDEVKIRRVIKILLENAIRFTEEGGVYIHIGCRRTDYGLNLGIDICDTGIGMTPAQLNRVYSEFYQADSGRSRKIGGMGLGLPIAHGLVHAMGGFMNIKSRQQKGTQVHISIPQMIGDEEPCMSVRDPGAVCMACYIGQEQYSGEVREYYNRMLKNLGSHFGIKLYRVFHFPELQSLCQSQNLTHLLIGRKEYEKRADYYEDLGKDVCIVLVAGRDGVLPGKNNFMLINKPFYALPIVNILNESKEPDGSGNSVSLAEGISCEGVRALVVDDDQMNLTVARGIFINYGMEVDTCLSGETALEACMQAEYDVIFLDHMMPGMDGVETLKRIRMLSNEIYKELPVIALTANAVSGAREMFKSEGFDEFVAKPIERSVLERVLRRVLPGKCRRIKAGRQMARIKEEKKVQANLLDDKKEKTDNSPLAFLGQKGFNVKQGIGYCADSEDFYLEMLSTFYQSASQKQEEIDCFYQEKDWENYTVKVHALKSASRTVGANELSESAARLEQAGKSRDVEYIEENHPLLLKLYEKYRDLIGEGMENGKEDAGNEKDECQAQNADDAPEIPEVTWQETLDGIAGAFDTFEGDQAQEMIRKVSGFVRHGRSCGELFEVLSGYIEDFDFEAAGKELERLRGEEEKK